MGRREGIGLGLDNNMTISNKTTVTVTQIEVYVSPTGNDNNSGSSSSPVKTIKRAIDLANTGNTILVRDGTYKEKIDINKSVTIKGNSYNSIIDGTGIFTETGKTLIMFLADNIKLDRLKIINSPGYGIGNREELPNNQRRWNRAYNSNISNCILDSTNNGGIVFHYSSNLTLYANYITRTRLTTKGQEGISIAKCIGFNISYNHLKDNGVSTGGGGMYIKAGSKGIATNWAKCHHNYIENTYPSIYSDAWGENVSNEYIEISNNIVINKGTIWAGAETAKDTSIQRNISISNNIMTNTEGIRFPVQCPFVCKTPTCADDTVGYPTLENFYFSNNVIYKNGSGMRIGWPTTCTYNPKFKNINVNDNIVCNNTPYNGQQIFIGVGIPATELHMANNHTAQDYITQVQFDERFNILKNEIKSKNNLGF